MALFQTLRDNHRRLKRTTKKHNKEVTEEELRQHIESAAERPCRSKQPPFADVAFPLHPNDPVDYELVRAELYERILGSCASVFHPACGAPHVDVYKYPPTGDRPFWCYMTNGMSDFPQLLPNGSSFRSEIMCASLEEWPLAPELLQILGTMPFRDDTYLQAYHTVPFPAGVGDPRFTYIMTTPTLLLPELDHISFLGEPLEMMSVIRITAEEQRIAVEQSSRYLIEELPDELDTWVIDGRLQD